MILLTCMSPANESCLNSKCTEINTHGFGLSFSRSSWQLARSEDLNPRPTGRSCGRWFKSCDGRKPESADKHKDLVFKGANLFVTTWRMCTRLNSKIIHQIFSWRPRNEQARHNFICLCACVCVQCHGAWGCRVYAQQRSISHEWLCWRPSNLWAWPANP